MEVIIKPTEACNGTCVYCSADGNLGKRKILPQERLGRLFDIFAEWMRAGDRRNVRFLWHGGEPMLCGPDYYTEIMRQQERAFGADISRIRNAMQSNLSLVDEQWVPVLRDLLKDQAVGTSFDIVDGIRGLAGDKDLREVWVCAVNRLRRAGIRVGVVYVAHRKSLGSAGDIYRFFRNLGLHVRVNPLYREGRAEDETSQSLWITAEQYGQFLVDLCEVWRADEMRCSLMPLMEWYRAWKGSSRLCCDSRGMCHTSHLGINPDGAVFGCGRQSDHRANRLGNIFEDNLDDMLRQREEGVLAVRSSSLHDSYCRDCRFWELCHGGCPMMGLLYHGDMLRETYFCAARKRMYEHFESLFGPPVVSGLQSAVSDQRSAISDGQEREAAGCPTSSGGEGATIASCEQERQFLRNPESSQGEPGAGEQLLRGDAVHPRELNAGRRTSPKAGRRGNLNPGERRTPDTRNQAVPPQRFVVIIEHPDGWPLADAARIVTTQPDLERLIAGRLEPDEKLRLVAGQQRVAASPSEYAPFARRLTVVADLPPLASQATAHLANHELLREMRAELMFSPATIGDGSRARQAADAGVPVRLEFSTDYEQEVLSGVLDHFLHGPDLQVPIEPFYSLAQAVARHRKLTLWHISDSLLGRCFFIDAQRHVSLSSWWAKQGLFLGVVGEDIEAMRRSAAWQELEACDEQVFISQTQCAFCEHYPYCGGIWRAASKLDTACVIWQRLMDRMAEAYRRCTATR